METISNDNEAPEALLRRFKLMDLLIARWPIIFATVNDSIREDNIAPGDDSGFL